MGTKFVIKKSIKPKNAKRKIKTEKKYAVNRDNTVTETRKRKMTKNVRSGKANK
mgnify:CR=1 FL=1